VLYPDDSSEYRAGRCRFHKGDILMVIDQARYTRALAQADATVAARKADLENAEQQAARRAKLTQIAISADARETAILTAHSAAAAEAGSVRLLEHGA
jgi:multidrug resistance efflux pump